MNQPSLIIEHEAYELWLDEKLLTRLAGGAATLLPEAGSRRLREIDIEAAIERAEDWLMPFSKALQGLQLKICDKTDRLKSYFDEHQPYSVEQIERIFSNVHYEVAHVQEVERNSVADIVLVREFAHHGRLSGIVLNSADPGPQDTSEKEKA
ncbi:hypothetical protein [Castellaniella sp.]|uniref:hypothetical protein n=1 Tax=Castellaniella sp. TaxID=1955812 RepID=UPI003A908A71